MRWRPPLRTRPPLAFVGLMAIYTGFASQPNRRLPTRAARCAADAQSLEVRRSAILQRLDNCTYPIYTWSMTDPADLLFECTGFQWDEGNAEKNWIRHQVSRAECEELFFNEPLIVAPDIKHSTREPRFYVLGQTDEGRRLFAVFTIRDRFIRVISARDMNKREEKEYERAQAKENEAQDTEI